MAQNMKNWAAAKGRKTAEDHNRVQRKAIVNRYNDLKFAPKTFEERRSIRAK